MKSHVRTMIGWHETLTAIEAFVNNYNENHFSLFDATVLETAANIIRQKIGVPALTDTGAQVMQNDIRDISTIRQEELRLCARLQQEREASRKLAQMLESSNATIAALRDRVTELERANLSTICAYCGTFFEADADGRKVDDLQAHMKVCEKHPMRKLERELAAERGKVDQAVFVSKANSLTAAARIKRMRAILTGEE